MAGNGDPELSRRSVGCTGAVNRQFVQHATGGSVCGSTRPRLPGADSPAAQDGIHTAAEAFCRPAQPPATSVSRGRGNRFFSQPAARPRGGTPGGSPYGQPFVFFYRCRQPRQGLSEELPTPALGYAVAPRGRSCEFSLADPAIHRPQGPVRLCSRGSRASWWGAI